MQSAPNCDFTLTIREGFVSWNTSMTFGEPILGNLTWLSQENLAELSWLSSQACEEFESPENLHLLVSTVQDGTQNYYLSKALIHQNVFIRLSSFACWSNYCIGHSAKPNLYIHSWNIDWNEGHEEHSWLYFRGSPCKDSPSGNKTKFPGIQLMTKQYFI